MIIIVIMLLMVGINVSRLGAVEDGVKIIAFAVLLYFITKFINSMTAEPEENREKIINSFKPRQKLEKEINKAINDKDNFDEHNFLNFAENMFIKYYIGMKEKDVKYLKKILTSQLFEKCEEKINDSGCFNSNGDRIQVKKIYLNSYNKNENKEIASVILKYIEIKKEYNRATGEEIRGLTKRIDKVVKITFEGIKTTSKEEKVSATKCPMCGAPTKVVTTGKCEYCGEVIQIEEINWKISDIKYL